MPLQESYKRMLWNSWNSLKKAVTKSVKQSAKSAGTYFYGSNGAINGQTHVAIPFIYAAAFVTQRIVSSRCEGKVSNRFAQLLIGDSGPNYMNAIETTLVGMFTEMYRPDSPLGTACLCFGSASGVQTLIRDKIIKFPDTPRGKLLKSMTLAGLDMVVLGGLALVAVNAGFTLQHALEIVIPGLACASLRAFKPQWLPPSVAYLDMMALAVATGVEAFTTGHWLNGVSRIISLPGYTRLAVQRAEIEKKQTVFEVERWVRPLVRKVPPLVRRFRNQLLTCQR